MGDKPYIVKSYDGCLPFSLVHTCFEQESPECNYCWGAYAFAEVSFRISSNIWPPPIDDHWMRICRQCWQRTVTVNPRYVVRTELSGSLTTVIVSLVMGYLY